MESISSADLYLAFNNSITRYINMYMCYGEGRNYLYLINRVTASKVRIKLKNSKNGRNQLKMSNSIHFFDWIWLFGSFNWHFKHSFWSLNQLFKLLFNFLVVKDRKLNVFNWISTLSFNRSLNSSSHFKSDWFWIGQISTFKFERLEIWIVDNSVRRPLSPKLRNQGKPTYT